MPSKARDLLEKEKVNGEKRVLSSGVEVLVKPFPGGLWEKIQARAKRDFPDPTPPKKEIDTFGGKETVDDLNDADYLTARRQAELERTNLLGEAVLDICIEVDMSKYEAQIKRLELYTDPYPDDPEDRRVRFLQEYVVRSEGDWGFIFASAIEQVQATDPEVSERIESFRDKVSRPVDTNGKTPSPDEIVGVDVQPAV